MLMVAMTVEERFERIEHITAGMVEQGRKDREENRQLWRDTQRQIADLTRKIADTNDAIVRLGEESRAADQRLEDRMDRMAERMDRMAEESRAADQQLQGRIEALVSAIGKMLAK